MGVFSEAFERRGQSIGGGRLDVNDDFWFSATGGQTSAGISVTEKSSLKYLSVLACVSLISGDIGRLPLILYQRKKDGSKTRVMDHSLADLLHNSPNPLTTSFQWRELAQLHLLLWGNAYSEITRKPRTGEIVSLTQIPSIETMRIKSENGKILYLWRDSAGVSHKKERGDIFHIPGMGWDGLVGMSMIALARQAIAVGLAAEEFGGSYFGKGTHPAGVLEMDGWLGDNEEHFKTSFKDQYSGLGKSHSVIVLEGGTKYKSLTMPLEDAQFLQTRDHQKVEICGIYHVPPHKIALHGQNSNYNNLEQENGSYVDSCLMHWIVRWEQGISQQLLTATERKQGLFVEFLVDGLLRGDSQARGEFYTKMFQLGGMSPNDIRAKENMNPVEGGDQHFVQLNMIPLDQADQIDALPEGKSFRARTTIRHRDRIKRQYYPLFKNAAQDIVNREGIAIKKKINQQRKQRAAGDMESWLRDFYKDMPEYIEKKLGPVIRSYMEAINSVASGEVGVDDKITQRAEKLINDYVSGYSQRHIDSSLGQLISLLEGEIDEIETRVDEWEDTRADKIAMNETVRASEAMVAAVFAGAGFAMVWHTRGESCEYCNTLQGKRIKDGEAFLNAGDEISPEGKEPMPITGLTKHPPAHQGCQCYLVAG